MSVLFAHATGNTSTRACLAGMVEDGLLAEFVTTFAWNSSHPLNWWLPERMKSQLQRRGFDTKVLKHTRCFPGLEVMRLVYIHLFPRWAWKPDFYSSLMEWRNRLFDQRVADHIRKLPYEGVQMVFSTEDIALESFRAAKERGWKCFYDLPIGHWRSAQKILKEEAELNPAWAMTMEGILDPGEKLARKDQEISLADGILVASHFTQNSLGMFPGICPPVYRVSYAGPTPVEQRRDRSHSGALLKVMYIGSLTQRKGISYLFEAMEKLKGRAELTVVGIQTGAECAPLNRALQDCRWHRSLPHTEILRLLEQQDVLVFPSLFEGFGFVLLEAMSRGVPVITTAHTGGPDFLEQGREGFIVPIRSATAIQEKLELLDRDRNLLEWMSQSAWKKSGEMQWDSYRRNVVQAIRTCLNA